MQQLKAGQDSGSEKMPFHQVLTIHFASVDVDHQEMLAKDISNP